MLGRGSWRFVFYYLALGLIIAAGGHVSGFELYGPLLLITVALVPVAALWLVAVGINRIMQASLDRFIQQHRASAAESETEQAATATGTAPLPPPF
jgi:hypothetical protein